MFVIFKKIYCVSINEQYPSVGTQNIHGNFKRILTITNRFFFSFFFNVSILFQISVYHGQRRVALAVFNKKKYI